MTWPSGRQPWHVQGFCYPASPNISLENILPDLDHLAVQSGLIVRQTRKFSARGFLLTLLKAVSTGHASFGRMAAELGQCEARSLSRQALHQRMNPPVIAFLQSVLRRVMDSSGGIAARDGNLPFRRILLEDSTQFRMHPKHHPAFRAVSNNSGATAGAKVDVVVDLISGQGSLHPALLSLVPAEIEGATGIDGGRAMEVWLPGGTKILIWPA